jgi:hypothetical protein
MHTRGRRLKLTAVLALTVLTLTGFSTGRHHSSSRHKSGSGSSGGGCSSSRQDHDTSTNRRSDYRSTPGPTATSGGGSSSLRDGTAKLVSCATATKQYATVEVSNPNSRKATFSVDVTFKDAEDNEVDFNYADVKVPANGRATVRVRVLGTSTPVDHCEVDPRATAGT